MTARPGFLRQIKAARAEVQRLAVTMPHLFAEWQQLQQARAELARARADYRRALMAWRKRTGDQP